MDAGLATVLAAAITGGLTLIGVLVNKARKENKADHQYVQGLLTLLTKSTRRIENKVDRVDERLSDHLEFHLERGESSGRRVNKIGSQENS